MNTTPLIVYLAKALTSKIADLEEFKSQHLNQSGPSNASSSSSAHDTEEKIIEWVILKAAEEEFKGLRPLALHLVEHHRPQSSDLWIESMLLRKAQTDLMLKAIKETENQINKDMSIFSQGVFGQDGKEGAIRIKNQPIESIHELTTEVLLKIPKENLEPVVKRLKDKGLNLNLHLPTKTTTQAFDSNQSTPQASSDDKRPAFKPR